MKKEIFPLVDETGKVIGKATREECHSGSFLLHPVVHLHVINDKGQLFLQKRSATKDIQPDKWDTSVGGHVDYGEKITEALLREAREELGIRNITPVFMLQYKFISEIEAELVHSYYTIYDGEISLDPVEISDGKFWSLDEISNSLNKNLFTPNFEQEFSHLIKNRLLPLK